jgi:hypothetical protein
MAGALGERIVRISRMGGWPKRRLYSRLNWLALSYPTLGAIAVELTSEDLREIDNAASKITLQGARLPEAALKMTGR